MYALRDLAIKNGAHLRARPFMLVLGIRLGSYVGAFLGTVWAVIRIARDRGSIEENDLR